MTERVALANGKWQSLDNVSLALDDWGFVQGATLVERLRTVKGHPLDAQDHLVRLRSSAQLLGIRWPSELCEASIIECVARNRAAHEFEDFSVVVLLTPGRSGSQPVGEKPTSIVHTTDLNWIALKHWYTFGQPLVTAVNRNVPGQCWSPGIKTRSRLHYFLADHQANMSGLPHAGAAMLSIEGYLTETSVANILLVDGRGLVSPPIDSVLHGLSLQRTVRLAAMCGLSARFESITLDHVKQAQEILITGSSGCLWPASQLDDKVFSSPTNGPVFAQVRDAWIQEIGIDYVAQAMSNA